MDNRNFAVRTVYAAFGLVMGTAVAPLLAVAFPLFLAWFFWNESED